jgi:hypothetical protein
MNNEKQQTAMQQLLNQLREERSKLPMSIEWDRCYQAIESVIKNTYLEVEKEQMMDFAVEVFANRYNLIHQSLRNMSDEIFDETYGGSK